MGRLKMPLQKIADKRQSVITFSKRRTGLFSKASDLARAGCEVAVIVFSAVDNVFTFGHPSVEAVAGRFLGQEDINLAPPGLESEGREGLAGPPTGGQTPPTEEEDDETIIVQDKELESEDKQEDGELRDGDEEKMADHDVATKGESLAEEPLDSCRFWWNNRIDDLEFEKLVEFESSLMEMQDRVLDRANKLLIEKPTMGFSFNFNNSKFKFRFED